MTDEELEVAIGRLLEGDCGHESETGNRKGPRNKFWRLVKKVAKADSLMRRTRHSGFCPLSRYVYSPVRIHTTLHSGVYVKGCGKSGKRQFLKHQSAKKVRNFHGKIPDGKWEKKLYDLWWNLI